MTVTRKTSYKECQAILADPNSSEAEKKAASQRIDDIKKWLDGKKKAEGAGSKTQERGALHLDKINLPLDLLERIGKETEQILNVQLARIFFIEEGLRKRNVVPTGPFVGMLYNQQMEALRESPQ